jgi:hypothetical protein
MSLAVSNTSSIGEETLIQLVMHGVSSPHTRRAYRTGLVQEYRAHLEARTPSGLSNTEDTKDPTSLNRSPAREGKRLAAATINLRMATIKKLALEMADNGMLDQNVAAAIGRAKGVTQRGDKSGNWLSPVP